MISRPCMDCGEPSAGTRCPGCAPPDANAPTVARGYDHRWRVLSERARRLQPWCLDCGATEDLTTDHTPEAWARRAAGKPIRLTDVAVVCRPCNGRRGRARGPLTRGETPTRTGPRPLGKPNSRLHTGDPR